MTINIKKVYEQYKHLDILLSDEEWLGENLKDQITFDLWQAIKKDIIYE